MIREYLTDAGKIHDTIMICKLNRLDYMPIVFPRSDTIPHKDGQTHEYVSYR